MTEGEKKVSVKLILVIKMAERGYDAQPRRFCSGKV